MADDSTGPLLRRAAWPRSWRATNLALFLVLLLAFGTGVGAVATGSSRGAWVVVAHGVVGIVVVLLMPRKGHVVAGGLRRRRSSRWASVGLAVLTVGSLVSGLSLIHI